MNATIHTIGDIRGEYGLTTHARMRMGGRGLSQEVIDSVMAYGRVTHTRGAAIYSVGRKEVERLGARGVDLKSAEGVQVVCTEDGVVMTVYRNHNFRGLHPRFRNNRRRPWHQGAA